MQGWIMQRWFRFSLIVLLLLVTPIGQLDEDRTADSAGFSPFKVVGISVACIGVMLLGVLPWVGGWGLAFGLTLGFGLVLLVLGTLMTVMSRGSA